MNQKAYSTPCKWKGCSRAGTERAVLKRSGEVIGLCAEHYEYFMKRNILTSNPQKVVTETHIIPPTPKFQRPDPKA